MHIVGLVVPRAKRPLALNKHWSTHVIPNTSSELPRALLRARSSLSPVALTFKFDGECEIIQPPSVFSCGVLRGSESTMWHSGVKSTKPHWIRFTQHMYTRLPLCCARGRIQFGASEKYAPDSRKKLNCMCWRSHFANGDCVIQAYWSHIQKCTHSHWKCVRANPAANAIADCSDWTNICTRSDRCFFSATDVCSNTHTHSRPFRTVLSYYKWAKNNVELLSVCIFHVLCWCGSWWKLFGVTHERALAHVMGTHIHLSKRSWTCHSEWL